ncbi:hypothetical protein K3495_g4498 [Podosphaera aphanis]|nr:hypothetical protein K3495_g4498 [Podosphaera aphanis]
MGQSEERVTDSNKVWTSVITNTKYLTGLFNLDYSLKKNGTKYPLVALYTDQLPDEARAALITRGIPMQRVEYLMPQGSKDYSRDPRFLDCWTKLTPFNLTEYKRIVQLDSDMLVLRNMDELMEIELDEPELEGKGNRVFAAGHACVCNPLKIPHYPANWIKENCAFTTQHPKPHDAQDIAPPTDASPLAYINGGLQVINPSTAVYELIRAYMQLDVVADMDFADQSLLSELFKNRWVPLPYTYNALKTLRWKGVHAEIWRDEAVKNVHYILTPKPWDDHDAGTRNASADPTHAWWYEVNFERLAVEKQKGISPDGF